MGRPRKSVAELKRNGTYRADRHAGREDTPRFNGEPAMPNWLDDISADMWHSVVPELASMGIAKTVDSNALAGMCRWYSVWRSADARLKDGEGDSYKLAIEAATAWKNYSAIASKFGMTPVDRAKLSVEPDDFVDPKVAAIFGD